MNTLRIEPAAQTPESDWMPFPGGELEAPRPKARCADCRARDRTSGATAPPRRAVCFQCYRAELERNRKLKAASELNTASEARFQFALPFEPVNTSRLARLRTERQAAQANARTGIGACIEKRRRAQIEARHALARIFQGLKERRLMEPANLQVRSTLENATHAAELQLPESWLPFVVSR
jgi:uncharacterized SAM-binding protein YcdF (DUF218 family)